MPEDRPRSLTKLPKLLQRNLPQSSRASGRYTVFWPLRSTYISHLLRMWLSGIWRTYSLVLRRGSKVTRSNTSMSHNLRVLPSRICRLSPLHFPLSQVIYLSKRRWTNFLDSTSLMWYTPSLVIPLLYGLRHRCKNAMIKSRRSKTWWLTWTLKSHRSSGPVNQYQVSISFLYKTSSISLHSISNHSWIWLL